MSCVCGLVMCLIDDVNELCVWVGECLIDDVNGNVCSIIHLLKDNL